MLSLLKILRKSLFGVFRWYFILYEKLIKCKKPRNKLATIYLNNELDNVTKWKLYRRQVLLVQNWLYFRVSFLFIRAVIEHGDCGSLILIFIQLRRCTLYCQEDQVQVSHHNGKKKSDHCRTVLSPLLNLNGDRLFVYSC